MAARQAQRPKAYRDSRSLLELRRLAYRAPRDPGSRYVLQDALLETVPEAFEYYIAYAHDEDARTKREHIVWFDPERLYHRKSLTGRNARWSPSSWFHVGPAPFVSMLSWPTTGIEHEMRHVRAPQEVIVYRTQGVL